MGSERRKRGERGQAEEKEGNGQRSEERKGERDEPLAHTSHAGAKAEPRRVRVAHGNTYTRGISVGEGLPRLGTRKTSFVEYPTGTA